MKAGTERPSSSPSPQCLATPSKMEYSSISAISRLSQIPSRRLSDRSSPSARSRWPGSSHTLIIKDRSEMRSPSSEKVGLLRASKGAARHSARCRHASHASGDTCATLPPFLSNSTTISQKLCCSRSRASMLRSRSGSSSGRGRPRAVSSKRRFHA